METATVLSTLVGSLIGAAISYGFYREASEDLERKVTRLESVTTLLARYLEREGVLTDVELDERGILKGYTQTIKAGSIESGEAFGPALIQEDPPSSEQPN
jgi:hypothetical protein